ncbi:hypothetical protein [Flavobacterium sp.]|uniref:hypothetical protein n=1 Tax=Flavobacterium sp. TaxID=239 RepID=UPI00121E9D77|nr:hypothetical protein [Flavobacterium sp.]RZJ73889.1 MAG: hypothetical protein EOO49_00600 [Flavobacterium sp.]
MKKLLLLPLLAIAQSCAIYGLTDDYGKLSDEQKTHILPANFENPLPDHVYKVTGKELNAEIRKYPKALVYEFTNGCTSDACKPMIVYERFAKKNGYKLFLVMNGFGFINETMAQRNSFESPLYAIDASAYPTNRRSKYTMMFKKDLADDPSYKPGYWGLMFFENGKFVKELDYLPEG